MATANAAGGKRHDPPKAVTVWRFEAHTERMSASDLKYVVLRYFNVAGADPTSYRTVHACRHPPDQGRRTDRAWRPGSHGDLWYGLSNPGRHLHSRLHSRRRSRWRPYRGIGLLAGWRRERADELRVRPRYSVREVVDAVKRALASTSRLRCSSAGQAIRSPSLRMLGQFGAYCHGRLPMMISRSLLAMHCRGRDTARKH
jgi:hypothetical protein